MKKFNMAIMIFVAVLLTSIGYSAFSTQLFISNIVASVKPEIDTRISGVGVEETSTGTTSSYEEFNISNINSSVNMPYEDSFAIYQVSVTNYGNIVMGISSITNSNSNLKYELLDYNLEEEICDINDSCTLGATKILRIKISYNNYDANNTTQLFQLDFNFATYYSVTYTSITNNDYPSKIISGGTLIVNFTEAISNLNILMNNVMLNQNTDYTYSNNILMIPNVTGSIEISSSVVLVDDINAHYPISGTYITVGKNLTVTSLGNGKYEVNGTHYSSGNTFIRLTDYFESATTWTNLNSGDNIGDLIEEGIPYTFQFTYLSGSVTGITGNDQIKITLRQQGAQNIASIGYDLQLGSLGTESSTALGMIVLYIAKGSVTRTFDHYQFQISINFVE